MSTESNRDAPRHRWRTRWNDADAARFGEPLDLRAYGSRLLGGDRSLVLQGGGNTSLKSTWTDGRPCVHVKGTGADLGRVTAADFTPIDLDGARALLAGPTLDNAALMAALEPLKRDAAAPRPSIETLMHASLPARWVEHTHADSVLAVLDTADGKRTVRKVFGAAAPLVPFRHSGFDLAQACMATFDSERTDATQGLLLAAHGVVAFADDARTSYERMGALIARAEDHLERHGAWTLPVATPAPRDADGARRLATLRRRLSATAGFPLVLAVDDSPEAVAFARRADLADIALQGPPTPQHAVFTKRVPSLGFDVDTYAASYRDYLARHRGEFTPDRLPDAAARIVLDPAFGAIAASVDGRRACDTAEVQSHDIAIISRAAALDRYVSLPPADILVAEVHYGGFERRLLARRATDLPLLGCVILLVGAPDDALRTSLESVGADVAIADDASEAVAIDLAWRFGGLDAVVYAATRSTSALVDTLLAESPAGGFVIHTRDADDAIARLRHHWFPPEHPT